MVNQVPRNLSPVPVEPGRGFFITIFRVMQQHIYTATRKKIIGQSWSIWAYVAMQVVFTVVFVIKWRDSQLWGLLFVNAVLGTLTVPGIILFIRYYRYSVGKKFIVTYNTLRYVDDKTGQFIELINTEIEKVILVETTRKSQNLLPWLFHEYFILMDSKGKTIIITSYIMGLGDFWVDTLTGRVSNDNIVREEKTYPWFDRPLGSGWV